jgi:hypothetical protein
MILTNDDLPPLNSQKKCERYCNPILDKLNNEDKYTKLFLLAVAIVDRSGADVEDKQALKSRAMTDQILAAYDGEKI